MRNFSLKTFFFIVGFLTVMLSAGIFLSRLLKKFTIELFGDDAFDEDFIPDEDVVVEPVIVCVDTDDETGEPQSI